MGSKKKCGTPDRIEVSASDLKKSWHKYLDQVSRNRQELVVTRYGHPVAKLVPFEEAGSQASIFGCLAGTVTIHGDIVAPLDASSEAND